MLEQSGDGSRHTPLVVGITGMAGSGKSTVTHLLSALGAQTVDADALVRWTYNDSRFQNAIFTRFGPGAITADGDVNREALAGIVFNDPAARADLERMVHPAVIAQMMEIIEEYRSDLARAPLLALEIPLLYESGADSLVDRVLVVSTPLPTCAERLRGRGWSEERIAAVMAAQMPLEEKVARADDIIAADGSVEDTALAVDQLWDRLTSLPAP